MSYFISFEMPGLPSTLNARMHWSKKNKERKLWHQLVMLSTAGKRPLIPLKTAELILTRVSATPMDCDNLVSGFKFVIDGLVQCGILEDDKWENIGMPTYRWEQGKRKDGKIRVEVWETVVPKTEGE